MISCCGIKRMLQKNSHECSFYYYKLLLAIPPIFFVSSLVCSIWFSLAVLDKLSFYSILLIQTPCIFGVGYIFEWKNIHLTIIRLIFCSLGPQQSMSRSNRHLNMLVGGEMVINFCFRNAQCFTVIDI